LSVIIISNTFSFFCFRKVARDNRTRLKRKNTLDNGEEDFCASLAAQPALARLELPDTFAEK
jgi:hypothetical protein